MAKKAEIGLKIDNLEMGRRIAQIRSEMGYTQEAFAVKLGLSRNAIALWETGKRQPQIESIAQISKDSGVSINWIVFGDEANDFLSETGYRKAIRDVCGYMKENCDGCEWLDECIEHLRELRLGD